MGKRRVLVIGGYGFFGRRLADRLARQADVEVLLAGRSIEAARAAVNALRPRARAPLEAVALDAASPRLDEQLRTLGADIVVNASGPFQSADHHVPRACIAAGVNHIDLADAPAYVAGITALHPAAADTGVFVISGASSVPALSSAAADALALGMAQVRSIDIGISPGNRAERGLATVHGVLSYCGQPLAAAGAGVYGWAGTHTHDYQAPVGRRLLSPCDVPDLTLLPPRYPGAPVVRFGAGLELAFLHRGMNLMAWLARRGFVHDWSRHAALLKRAADLFREWGSDAGAMHVSVSGVSARGESTTRSWQLIATHGDGPFVPTLAAAALVRKAVAGSLPAGAQPCVGLLSLQDFARETEGLHITMGAAP